MFARGSGTGGEVGKTGVRRVQRELYRGGATVVRGTETVGVAVRNGTVISEFSASSRGSWSQGYRRHNAVVLLAARPV